MDLLSLRKHQARMLLIHYLWDVEKLFAVLVERGKSCLFSEAGITIVDHLDEEAPLSAATVISSDYASRTFPDLNFSPSFPVWFWFGPDQTFRSWFTPDLTLSRSSLVNSGFFGRIPIQSGPVRLLTPKRRLANLILKTHSSSASLSSSSALCSGNHLSSPLLTPLRTFSSSPISGPAAIDYSSLINEEDFQRLVNVTVHDLQEKLEEYGDSVQIDGFDVEYGNEVLTVKLGSKGTYVLNKQTPNRQLWLSSPVSGPSRYDWDSDARAWIYRRTKANLLTLLENEFEQLCGEPIRLD